MSLHDNVAMIKHEMPEQRVIDPDKPYLTTIDVIVKTGTRLAGAERLTHVIGKALVDAGYGNVVMHAAQLHEGIFDKESPFHPSEEDLGILQKVQVVLHNNSVDNQHHQPRQQLSRTEIQHWAGNTK